MACCGPGLPQKVEYLKTTPFLLLSPNGESDESISELAKLCVVSTLGKGKPFALPKQVEGGAFALCCTGGLGNPSSSELSHKPGDFWHSSSSMTVLFAKEKSRLLFVPMSAIETILAKKSDKLLRAIVELNISAILDEVPYMKLANLEKDSLEALKPLFMFEAFADGKAVYETGEPADRLYILVHGDIAVTDKDGKVVRTFHAPNFFGATAMLDAKAKRTFTASASGGAAALLSLSRDKLRLFKECFKESGTQLETLMFQEARGRMLTTTLMKGGLLSEAENAGKFKDPGEQVARYIALGGCIHCHPRIPAGEPLIAEGAVAPAVFFVYQGKLYPRAYTPPVAEREEPAEIRRGSSQSAMAGKSPRTSSTKEGAKDKGSTPRQEGIKDKAKKADAPEEPDDSLTTGKYVKPAEAFGGLCSRAASVAAHARQPASTARSRLRRLFLSCAHSLSLSLTPPHRVAASPPLAPGTWASWVCSRAIRRPLRTRRGLASWRWRPTARASRGCSSSYPPSARILRCAASTPTGWATTPSSTTPQRATRCSRT